VEVKKYKKPGRQEGGGFLKNGAKKKEKDKK
jgi:hypothetical protein